jgi:hypothetical protein
MKLLSWGGKGYCLIQDGQMFSLAYEKQDGAVPHRQEFTEGWGSLNGKTLVLWKTPITANDLELEKTAELANGTVIEFRKTSYRHGDHIGDIIFYQFAFIDGLVVGWAKSSPWDNPQRDFARFRERIMAKHSQELALA